MEWNKIANMRLWDNKHLSIKFTEFPNIWAEPCDFKISKNVYDLVSERLNMLKLVPANKYFKNKLKTKETIQFGIYSVPFSIEPFSAHKKFHMNKPDFKKITDTVAIDLMLPFIQYNENNYTQIFLNNLEMAIAESLLSLRIYSEYMSQTFNEIKKEVNVNKKYWYYI